MASDSYLAKWCQWQDMYGSDPDYASIAREIGDVTPGDVRVMACSPCYGPPVPQIYAITDGQPAAWRERIEKARKFIDEWNAEIRRQAAAAAEGVTQPQHRALAVEGDGREAIPRAGSGNCQAEKAVAEDDAGRRALPV